MPARGGEARLSTPRPGKAETDHDPDWEDCKAQRDRRPTGKGEWRMNRALWMAVVAVALLSLLFVAPHILGSGGAVTRAAPDFSLEIDTDPTGNTGDSLGPTEVCRQVSAGQSFDVDVVAKEAPPLFGVEVSLLYDPAVLRITAIQVNSGLFLGKLADSSIFNFSNPTPDEDGEFRAAAAEFRNAGPSGDGAVFRLTLQAKAEGTSPFRIATDDPETFFNEGPVVPDTDNNPLAPLLSDGEIRVGQQGPCPASEPPPTPPQPTPTPEDTPGEPTPTPEDTPGEADGTPGTMEDTPQTKLIEDVSDEDTELVVADAEVFKPGDIIQLEDEKLRVISASDGILRVERGVEGTEATEHSGDLTLVKVDDEMEAAGTDDDSVTAHHPSSGTGSDSSSGTDLTEMPWVAVWAALGVLAAAGSGGALLWARQWRRR